MGFAPVHLSMSMIISISGGYWSEAAGINQAGQVTGRSLTVADTEHAFITDTDGMGMRDVGTFRRSYSFAYGINNAGRGERFRRRGACVHYRAQMGRA
jgi:probable HAF family extracellular repeat protein